MVAETKAYDARYSGLTGEIVECDHGRWFALFVTGPWIPEWYGPSRWPLHIEVVDGKQVVLSGPPSIAVETPCGCPSGQRMAPSCTVEFFAMEGEG